MENRQYSSLKIFHHKTSLESMKNEIKQAPLYIRIKPTNLCNHHCSYCSYGAGDNKNLTSVRDSVKRTDMIPWNKMKEIISDISAMGVKAITFSGGGEPLTYPHIIEAVEMVKKQGIDLSLISNGQLLNGKIAMLFYDAKWVRISFDSPNEKEYMQLRNVSDRAFQRVCMNIQDFAKYKSHNCILGINFVVSNSNYHRIYEAAKFLKDLGVDNVKFASVVDNHPNYHVNIKNEAIRQIHQAQEEFASKSFKIINNYENDWMDKNFKSQSFDKCYTCKLVTIIAADQKVYFCHTRAYDSNAVLGDLHSQSFRNMWFAEETCQKLNNLSPRRDCKNFCVYEERNKLIQAYFDVDMNHINFI